MKLIRAFNLPCILKKSFEAELQAGEILSVEVVRGQPLLFCLIDDGIEEKRKHLFRFYGNEEEVHNRAMVFIGSVVLSGGKVCLHLFEIEQPARGLLLPNA